MVLKISVLHSFWCPLLSPAQSPSSTFFLLFVLVPTFAYSELSLACLTIWMEDEAAQSGLERSEHVWALQGPSSFLGGPSGVTNSGSFRPVTFPREGHKFPVWELKIRLSMSRGDPSRRLSVQSGLRSLPFRRPTVIWSLCLLPGVSHPPLCSVWPGSFLIEFLQIISLLSGQNCGEGITHLCGLTRAQNTPYGRCGSCAPALFVFGTSLSEVASPTPRKDFQIALLC